jgi:transcriptional regulator with XRE-family HTH domain
MSSGSARAAGEVGPAGGGELSLAELIGLSSLGGRGARRIAERVDPLRARRLLAGVTVGDEQVGPTVRRIGLGSELRRRREAAGLTRGEAGAAIRASTAKISRLELGRVGFKERDVTDLLTLYGVTDDVERAEFLRLTREANIPGWWQRYSDLLPSWFETYLGLEQAASVIRTYELQFVPGLLQTREYARAVIGLACTRAEEVERRVELRMHRQHLLTASSPPAVWAVIDEAALRRSIGGPDLVRHQLDHLLDLNELPHVSIQIAPLTYGGHPAAGGAFTLLRFAHPDLPDIVYLEQLTSALYLDKRSDSEHYSQVMNRLVCQIDQPDRTADILSRLRARI